jgi:hypothetical protein
MRMALVMALTAWGQEQQPRYQADWPCSGKERALDPTYSKIAIQGSPLAADANSPGHFQGAFAPGAAQFRVPV